MAAVNVTSSRYLHLFICTAPVVYLRFANKTFAEQPLFGDVLQRCFSEQKHRYCALLVVMHERLNLAKTKTNAFSISATISDIQVAGTRNKCPIYRNALTRMFVKMVKMVFVEVC